MKNNILGDDESKINDIVSNLCQRSGEYIINFKNEGDNKTFFEAHITEIAKAIANVKQKDLNNNENDLNKFLFMCIGLFDTDDSRKIIYDKLTYPGIISVFKDMDNNHKLKYSNYLPDDLVTNDYFFAQLSIEPNSKVGKLLDPVYRFIHRHKNSDRPWILDELEKSFFANSKEKIRDAIAKLSKEDFKGNEDEANKFKLSCCGLFSEEKDRQVIFKTIGDGSDADIFLTFQNLKLTEQQGRELFPYLPADLQIKDVFEYTFKCRGTVDDLERQMSQNLQFKTWGDYFLSIGFIFLCILLAPTGLTNLILWCSSDYRKALKQEKIEQKLCGRINKELSAEDEKEIKSEIRGKFIIDIITSIGPVCNFAFVTYCFIVLPFGVFLSSFWLFLVLELGLMVYMFIVMFKPIKSLCTEIKDTVENNQQIQRTLNERRNKWQETKQKMESKQREPLAKKILLLDDKPAWSENEINTDFNKNPVTINEIDNNLKL